MKSHHRLYGIASSPSGIHIVYTGLTTSTIHTSVPLKPGGTATSMSKLGVGCGGMDEPPRENTSTLFPLLNNVKPSIVPVVSQAKKKTNNKAFMIYSAKLQVMITPRHTCESILYSHNFNWVATGVDHIELESRHFHR